MSEWIYTCMSIVRFIINADMAAMFLTSNYVNEGKIDEGR